MDGLFSMHTLSTRYSNSSKQQNRANQNKISDRKVEVGSSETEGMTQRKRDSAKEVDAVYEFMLSSLHTLFWPPQHCVRFMVTC